MKLIAGLCVLASAPVLAVTLTPGDVEVVVDRSATPTARYAGREATNFLSQVLGAAVPVVAEPTAGRTHLFVGDGAAARAAGFDVSKLKRDAFHTRVKGGDIYLLGRDDPKEDPQAFADGNLRFFAERATLFAVYDFLERCAGCRFFFPGEIGTVVPRKAKIDVPDCDRVTAPDSDERRYTRDPVECGTWYDKSVDRRALHGVAWMRWRLATRTLPCCHGQRYFKYVSRFSKKHPDWFCLKADGTRDFSEHEHELAANNKFCYTSGIREEIYRDAKAYLSGARAATRGLERWGANCRDEVVDVMPEDGFAECHCANCQAAYTKCAGKDRRGNYANDLIWGLTAEIGRRLKAEGVPGYITQMAYHPYGDVPSFDLPDNIQVMVATRGPWDVAKPEAFAKAVARVRAWCEKTGNRVWLWTYPGNYYGDYSNVPVVCPRAYAKFYKAVAPYARFGFAENMCDRFAYDLVNLYVFSRLAWDPSIDVDALLDDYCGNLFGPAAAPMKEVIDLFEEKWIGGVCSGGTYMTPVGPKPIKIADAQLYSEIYTDEFFRRMESLFAEAGRLTAEGSRERRAVGLFHRELLKPLRTAKDYLDPAVELRRRAAAKPTNLLSNADFADGMKGWNTQTPKAPPAFDANDKVTGAACCELDGIGGEPPHYYTLASIYQNRIPVKKGRTYRLSYFLKCKDVVPTALAQWHGAGAGGVVWLPNKRYFKFPTPMSVGTHGWMHRSHEIKVQEDGEASVEFRLVQATGRMRICGVLLEELPNDETGR